MGSIRFKKKFVGLALLISGLKPCMLHCRTKLKQMEVDCDFLKKCCESLRDENWRLKKELQELKSIKLGSPFYIQLPKAAATGISVCPSCERLAMNEGNIAKKEIFGPMEDSSMTC